jgi:Ca-activated chloride channel homolog
LPAVLLLRLVKLHGNRSSNMVRAAKLNWVVLMTFVISLCAVTNVSAQSPVTIDKLPPPPPAPSPKPRLPKDDDFDVVRVTSNLVIVPVSVTDTKGQPTLGLSAADFQLEEQGQTQEIAQIGDPEQVPLDITLLLDVSGSVDARFDFERESASRFLKQVLKTGDRAAVFAIDQEPRFEQALDTAARASNKLLSIRSAKGPTAFYDTVIEAARYLGKTAPTEHRRVIVVISDGEDNFSEKVKKAIGDTRAEQETATPQARQLLHHRMLTEVQRELQKADSTFYSINPSGPGLRLNIISQRAQDGMDLLATSTGGTSFVPERLEDLDAIFRQITAELRSQYLLQYYSKSEAPSGTFLTIGVQVPKRTDLRIRARQGYYVKRK